MSSWRPTDDNWRLRDSTTSVFAQAVLHAVAGPIALREFLQRVFHVPADSPQSPSLDVRSLFEMTLARLEVAGLDARVDAAVNFVEERFEREQRIVAASSFPSVAARFEEKLREVVGRHRVGCHYESMDAQDRDRAVRVFLESYDGCVLIADASMEEGRNLQGAEVLVNLDLPLDVNRLDQRIGRLDRYAVRPTPAEVVVFTESSSEWVSAHVALLADGIGVFETSVSTVQRLLADVLNDLVENLVKKGADAMRLDSVGLREDLSAEHEDIDLLEELESVQAATVFDDDAFGRLVEYEADPASLRVAVKRLATGTGSLDLRARRIDRRRCPIQRIRGIGLSVAEAEALDRMLQPKAYDRTAAVEQSGVSPFRVGDPLVDWLERYLVADERGRATAVARPVPGLSSPMLWLHCEFIVEFDSDQSTVPEGPRRRRLGRRGEAHLQPFVLETWTDPLGAAPTDLVEDYLSPPFDRNRDEVRGRIWRAVLEEFPAWSRLCQESVDAAWEEVRASKRLASGLSDALRSAEGTPLAESRFWRHAYCCLPVPNGRPLSRNFS